MLKLIVYKMWNKTNSGFNYKLNKYIDTQKRFDHNFSFIKLFATTHKLLFKLTFTAFTDSWAKIWNNRFNGIGPQENHFLVFGLLNEPKSSKTTAAKHTIYRNTRLSCFLKIIEFIKISFQTSHLNSYSDKSNKLW